MEDARPLGSAQCRTSLWVPDDMIIVMRNTYDEKKGGRRADLYLVKMPEEKELAELAELMKRHGMIKLKNTDCLKLNITDESDLFPARLQEVLAAIIYSEIFAQAFAPIAVSVLSFGSN